ncbi:MAG: hypothetical protein NZO16_06165 [Deltaproteobacteria bacterium]|nr:hypothetical protein [Deltaproteobacteria bacterium]
MSDCTTEIITLSFALERAGLVWHPEIGDEVSERTSNQIMILTDNFSLPPSHLRRIFLWLPRAEQLIEQIEARQGIITHVGWINDGSTYGYGAFLKIGDVEIRATSSSFRLALAMLLFKFLQFLNPKSVLH